MSHHSSCVMCHISSHLDAGTEWVFKQLVSIPYLTLNVQWTFTVTVFFPNKVLDLHISWSLKIFSSRVSCFSSSFWNSWEILQASWYCWKSERTVVFVLHLCKWCQLFSLPQVEFVTDFYWSRILKISPRLYFFWNANKIFRETLFLLPTTVLLHLLNLLVSIILAFNYYVVEKHWQKKTPPPSSSLKRKATSRCLDAFSDSTFGEQHLDQRSLDGDKGRLCVLAVSRWPKKIWTLFPRCLRLITFAVLIYWFIHGLKDIWGEKVILG